MALETDRLLGDHDVANADLALSKPLWIHYFELTRQHNFPIGSLLLFWPCAWGLTMAAYRTGLGPEALILDMSVFLLGSTLLLASGCVLNDLFDREFDGKVERSKSRPLVTGAVSVFGAWVFFLALMLAGAGLLLFTNRTAAIFGLVGIFPWGICYALMKRWTYWPQAWLGFPASWGFLVAWIHVTGKWDWALLPTLLLGTVCWTIMYDTMYAMQDRKDDIRAGVKSTAVLFGSWVRPILMVFASVFVASLVLVGRLNRQGPVYFAITCGGCAFHLLFQFATWDVNNPRDGGVKFKQNHDLGYVIWAGMALDYVLKVVL